MQAQSQLGKLVVRHAIPFSQASCTDYMRKVCGLSNLYVSKYIVRNAAVFVRVLFHFFFLLS